jgi:hypothetical protein
VRGPGGPRRYPDYVRVQHRWTGKGDARRRVEKQTTGFDVVDGARSQQRGAIW